MDALAATGGASELHRFGLIVPIIIFLRGPSIVKERWQGIRGRFITLQKRQANWMLSGKTNNAIMVNKSDEARSSH